MDNIVYVLQTVKYLWNSCVHLEFRRSFLTALVVFGFVSYHYPTVVLGFAKRWAAKDGIGEWCKWREKRRETYRWRRMLNTHTHTHTHTHTYSHVTNYHTVLQQNVRCSTWWNRTVVSDRQEDTSFLALSPVFRVSVSFVSWKVVVLLKVSSLWFSNFSFFCV